MPIYDYDTSGDIAMTYDAQIGYGDLVVQDRDLERDLGLRTAVIVSLFSNRRAEDVDVIPDEVGTREGWWADELRENDDKIGSKLWLIGRGKILEREIIPSAEQFGREALQWMVDDGVAESLTVEASFYDADMLQLDIKIIRPELERADFFRFFYNWNEEYSRSD